ncbi:centromere protein T isoform X1 [Pipistrellus kuhlii]|uniref:Centromere protein T n=1 Tax=Pipistrellus kuhlii TaxID=59472 RepID=A0A7J7UZD2_PIPKU|nr:centromere protein T isoform X1 [Pipistrellus kuhlii]KAF6318297.1 centromere protein T [Pipistrellus kuhlii]
MADSDLSDNEPTTRTLLRHVLDTEAPRTPRRRQSTRAGVQRALPESPFSMRLRSQTKTTPRRQSHRARSIGRLAPHIQSKGQLKEQTPRTLLENILLTAPESSMVMPESVVKPVPAPQVVQLSSRESSPGSLDLQLPELNPPTAMAPSLLTSGKRKKRLRLSEFQQGMDQGLPLSQEPVMEPPANTGASSLTSSLNLTFATPLLPQSVQRPGLARRPPPRRAVDVDIFLQDLQDTSVATALPGDRTPVATLPTDTVLEDTQPFSQPLIGRSPSVHHSLPHPSLSAERTVSRRTRSSGPGLQNNSPEKPAQLLAGKAEKVDALAMGFPNTSNGTSAEDELKPLLDRDGEEVEEIMEESMSLDEVKEAAGAQASARAEEPEAHMEVTEAEGSWGAVEAKEPERSSRDKDAEGRTARPELASSAPDIPQARQLEFLEPAPSTSTAGLSAEPLPARLPTRVRTAGPRLRQDPYKMGLSHYAKLFSFYAKMPMEKKALEMVEKCLDKYFQRLCDDLDVFAAHAGRKTVRLEDLELLMRRQGLVTDRVSLHVLVEQHLPLEYRQLLIPCAFSGNAVFPAQ